MYFRMDYAYEQRLVTLYRRQGSRPSPWKRNAKKVKWLSGSLEKTLMLGGTGGRRRRGRQRMRDMTLGELRKLVMDREAWRAAVHGITKSRRRLSDWTELNWRPVELLITLLSISKQQFSKITTTHMTYDIPTSSMLPWNIVEITRNVTFNSTQ